MKQKKISAVIPSNNNSKILHTIRSISEIADEIIIVNSAKDNFEFPKSKNRIVIEQYRYESIGEVSVESTTPYC